MGASPSPLLWLYRSYLPVILTISLIVGCRGEESLNKNRSTAPTVELKVLHEYEHGYGYGEDDRLQLPSYLRHDPQTGNLFVYDEGTKTVLEINSEHRVVNRYGGAGEGPGEIEGARNLFLTHRYLYVHDPTRFFIYRYDRDSTAIATFAYNTEGTDIDFGAPPQMPQMPFITDIHNQPAVTLNGHALLPTHREGTHLFERLDWEGNRLSRIGDLPSGYRPQMENEAYRKALEGADTPARDLHQAFPVNDISDPGQLFIVYSSIPKITKYDTTGNKLWEREIPHTPEVDSIVTNHLDYNRAGNFENRPDLQKYFFGIGGPEGELYLVAFLELAPRGVIPRPWVHRFNPEGELTGRYTFDVDADTYLLPFLAVDFENNRFLVISLKDSAVRAYPF